MEGWLLDFDPRAVLVRAQRHGADYVDLFAEHTREGTVMLRGGQLEVASRQEQRGMSLRALLADGRFQLASAAGIDATTALSLADRLPGFGATRVSPPAPTLGLEVHRGLAKEHPLAIHLGRRAELVRMADEAARAVAPQVSDVRVALSDSIRRIAVAASDGRLKGAETIRVSLAVEVIARRGEQTQVALETLGGVGGFELLDEGRVVEAAERAARTATRMLDARPAPSGVMPVLLAAEAGGTFVHEAVGHPLEADLVIEGLSCFGAQLGEMIASEHVTVIDDASLPGKNGTFQIDDEGTPAERTVLVDRGKLVRYLSDERSARILGGTSTGKARRESFRSRPLVRMSNTLIAPGGEPPEDILRATDRGLFVVRMGGGEVDTVTGHFVFEAAEAYLIRAGRVSDPVRGATITGETQTVLLAIDRVGQDLGFGLGICGKDGQDVPISDGEPTIRIPELVVGGPGE